MRIGELKVPSILATAITIYKHNKHLLHASAHYITSYHTSIPCTRSNKRKQQINKVSHIKLISC